MLAEFENGLRRRLLDSGRTAAQKVKGGFWLGGPLGQKEVACRVLASGDGHHPPHALA